MIEFFTSVFWLLVIILPCFLPPKLIPISGSGDVYTNEGIIEYSNQN